MYVNKIIIDSQMIRYFITYSLHAFIGMEYVDPEQISLGDGDVYWQHFSMFELVWY